MSDDGTTCTAIIDSEETVREWSIIKPLVVQQMYPRDKMAALWKIIHDYHKDAFPNLLKLAHLALILPVQTADCERGFDSKSYKDKITQQTAVRESGCTLINQW